MRIALVLVVALLASSVAAACETGCRLALLEGTLVAADGELVVETDPAGVAIRVAWPFGLGVREDGGELVVSDVLGTVKAREGDSVSLGGGVDTDGTFVVCGEIVVTGSPLRPPAPVG